MTSTNITASNGQFYWWFGVVENRDDPLRIGRCRVRILGYHVDDREILPTDDLPWAIPIGTTNSAGTSGVGWSPTGPVEGSWVVGFFADGADGQHPMFFGTVGSIPGGLDGRNDNCGGESGSTSDGGDSGNGGQAPGDPNANRTPTEEDIIQVISTGGGWCIVKLRNGKTVKREGPRNWRNHNPGNISNGEFSRRNGAVGGDSRFAIFPNYQTGRRAKEVLLFEDTRNLLGRGAYKDMTIAAAIAQYAPPGENNTTSYVQTICRALNVSSNTVLKTLNAQQRSTMLDAMQRVEGYRAGKVTPQG